MYAALIMISNSSITIDDLIGALMPEYPAALLGRSGFVVQRSRPNLRTAYVRVRTLDNPETQYDEDDSIPFSVGPQTKGFLIEFNDLQLLKEVAPLLADRNDVAVDDDHGTIVLGRDFVVGLRNSQVLGWLPPDYET